MAYRPGQSDVPLEETSEGVDKRRAMRLLVAGVAIIVAVVFMSQNNDKVELNFLMFSVERAAVGGPAGHPRARGGRWARGPRSSGSAASAAAPSTTDPAVASRPEDAPRR